MWKQKSDHGSVSPYRDGYPTLQIYRLATAHADRQTRYGRGQVAHRLAKRRAPSPDISSGACRAWPNRGNPPFAHIAPIRTPLW